MCLASCLHPHEFVRLNGLFCIPKEALTITLNSRRYVNLKQVNLVQAKGKVELPLLLLKSKTSLEEVAYASL